MRYDPVKPTAKKRATYAYESYLSSMAEIMKEMLEEKNMRGPVLEVATFLSTPDLNHRGTSTIPPPMPAHPPKIPAIKPLNIPYFIFL